MENHVEIEKIVSEVTRLINGPLNRQISKVDNAKSVRKLLDLVSPEKIYDRTLKGINDFLESEFGRIISNSTYKRFKTLLRKQEKIADELNDIWFILDEYEREGKWLGLDKTKYFNDPTWGALVGTIILPGIGTAIGGFLGQMNKRKNQQAFEEAILIYQNGVSKYLSNFEEDTIEILLPSILKDIQKEAKKRFKSSDDE